MNATYTKLRTGEWGVKISGVSTPVSFTPNYSVTVTKKDGTQKSERIAKIVWQGEGVAVCAITKQATTYTVNRNSDVYVGRNGNEMVRGCSACRSLGRMCKQCYFDEYDC